MSALLFNLLLHICVWNRIFQANGIQNLRYPTRFDNNQWRFGKRQDFLTKSRFYMWKPAFNPSQIYPSVKTPTVPFNFNRYGIQSSPPIMAPFHHGYMFAMPTKINYASYHPHKDIEEKRKPGNLHHITIINAIIPKPYLPTKATHSHPTTTFQNYRKNNKQLYHQYFNNFGRQNVENFSQINTHQFQLQQQQQQHQNVQMVFSPTKLALQLNKPTTEQLSFPNSSNTNNSIENEEKEVYNPVSKCGRKIKDDISNSGSNVLYYYCNNRITNYKNPTQQHLISVPPTTLPATSTTSTTTSTTTTTEAPFIPTTKPSRYNINIFTSEKPIFLPTPNTALENNFVPITSATTLENSIIESEYSDNFKLQRQKYKQKKYEQQPQTTPSYEDMKRHQYTTPSTYDNTKLHSFFTIEDAVTRAPEMQVFNDPYQAYRHARRQQINHHRQISTTAKAFHITTTTHKPIYKSFFDDLDIADYPELHKNTEKAHINHQWHLSKTTRIPDITITTTKPRFKSFFDDLNDDDYLISDAHQYDYSLFNRPQKSIYLKSEFKNNHQVPEHSQIIDHTHKPTEDHDLTAVNESPIGRPTVKIHHFGLFKQMSPTSNALPSITTYKPKKNFKELYLTTHKMPSLTSYNLKPITYTSTLETIFGNNERITGKESYNTEDFTEDRTTTSIPITTTTEKKSTRLTFKSPLNVRSSTTFKYPKQSLLQKSLKNLTSTTTKATSTLKKVPKYQRQYKAKKLKQFKHLYTTTSTTTTSTTTTAIPTTIESQTKRTPIRVLTTTEEPTTKKLVSSRTYSTTEFPKQRKQSSSTEATKRRKVKSRSSTTTTPYESSIRPLTARRGSKRANAAKSSEVDVAQTRIPKADNKHRRRIISSSTTAKPLHNRATPGLISTTITPASLRTSSTTTSMKSIMRLTNSKPRTKSNNDIRSTTKSLNEMSNDRFFDARASLKSTTSTMASIPPLPIEIYFKKSHGPKI